jgi:hypothetical protein
MFDFVLIPPQIRNRKLSSRGTEVYCSGYIDEKQHVVELVASVQLLEKPSRLFRRGRKEAYVRDFISFPDHLIRFWIDDSIQLAPSTINLNRCLIECGVIRNRLRRRL